jgi:GWxTD domain-containing protein
MKKIIRMASALTVVFWTLASSQVRRQDLPLKYREWLDLVEYIILPQESSVFFNLSSDPERDIFIESFWKQRDPTPGTPQNEFREEHLKRFLHANTTYGRGTVRKGWQTDMGRIYIILGPPNSVSDYTGTSGLRDCEVWYYYGDVSKGMPTYFALVFYKKDGSGEYRLYSPISDGPASLIENPSPRDFTEDQESYQKIKDAAPSLAPLSLSFIPGDTTSNLQPSIRSDMILASILEAPRKSVNPSYATHFLDYKGMVSTEYLTNYIAHDAKLAVLTDPVQNVHTVHICLNPASLSLDYYEQKSQFYCALSLDVSLRNNDRLIYQYSKEYPIYFSAQDAHNLTKTGISIQDCFPVVEGDFKLTVLYKNSVGKEFSVLEKEISVTPAVDAPSIEGPVIGYQLDSSPLDMQVAFKAADERLRVDPKDTFAPTDEVAFLVNILSMSRVLWEEGELRISVRGLKEKNPSTAAASVRLNRQPYRSILRISNSIPAKNLAPDYYNLTLSLVNGLGKTIDSKTANFIVSPKTYLARPLIITRSFPLASRYLYFCALAEQNRALGRKEAAKANYQKAIALAPDYKEGFILYARFLLENREFDPVLELVESFRDEEKLSFDFFALRGKALLGKGLYADALASLTEANRRYNSDIDVLNSLGFCFYKTGRLKEATDVLKASLRLQPDQPEPKKLLETIDKKSP